MSKKNRRAMRRALLSLSMMLVVAFVAVTGTIAWLTAETKVVTNTFSVGDVTINLDEAKVTEYGVVDGTDRVKENSYKLLPGHTYVKDPTVYVETPSEPCYVFVKVVNPIAAIEADATETQKKIAGQMEANNWLPLQGQENVYYYNGVVDARTAKQTLPVFANFVIKNDADVSSYAGTVITVDAYAVQQDGSNSPAEAWQKAPTDWTETTTPPAVEGEGEGA